MFNGVGQNKDVSRSKEMRFLRSAESRHKLFWAQFQFDIRIKTTLSRCTTKHMNFGPECKTRVSAANSSFWSKVKISQIAPNIFPTFYQFPGRFSLTLQHIKNLESPFSVSANYHRFRLLTWSKIKNFDFFYNMPFNSFSKRIILDFMFLVKFF